MDCHVEVGEMNVPMSIQEDIIRLDITAHRNQLVVSICHENSPGNSFKNVPVNDLLTVEIVACRRQFSGPEADARLVDLSLAFHMDCMRVNGMGPDPLCQIRD